MARVCPRCGRGGRVETLAVTSASIWLRCGDCGHLWREPGTGLDPFAVILAHVPSAVPVREDYPPSGKPRATRFQVRLPLRFRPKDHRSWRRGLIENISRSGLLFRSRDFIEPSTPVSFLLSLRRRFTGEPSSRIRCDGSIVRAVPVAGERRTLLAAVVEGYEFVEESSAP